MFDNVWTLQIETVEQLDQKCKWFNQIYTEIISKKFKQLHRNLILSFHRNISNFAETETSIKHFGFRSKRCSNDIHSHYRSSIIDIVSSFQATHRYKIFFNVFLKLCIIYFKRNNFMIKIFSFFFLFQKTFSCRFVV